MGDPLEDAANEVLRRLDVDMLGCLAELLVQLYATHNKDVAVVLLRNDPNGRELIAGEGTLELVYSLRPAREIPFGAKPA